jgi:hypothetical protein
MEKTALVKEAKELREDLESTGCLEQKETRGSLACLETTEDLARTDPQDLLAQMDVMA